MRSSSCDAANAPNGGVAIDVPGAALIATGMFLLVFGLSEGAIYGWITPLKDFSIAGHVAGRPRPISVSIIPLVFVTSVLLLAGFFFLEHAKERNDGDPLFEFAYLRFRTYRYGLLTGLILSMGQLGISFVLPVFLQNGRHISVWHNGLWVLAVGLFVIVGAQLGGRLIHRFGTIKVVVRMGLLSYAIGVLVIFRAISLHITEWQLLPGLAFFGMGIGFALAQLTNVVLSEIPADGSGVGERRQHHRAPGRQRARRRGHRIAAHRADGQPRGVPHQGRDASGGTVKANAIAGVHA